MARWSEAELLSQPGIQRGSCRILDAGGLTVPRVPTREDIAPWNTPAPPARVTEAPQTKPWDPYRSKTEYRYAALLDTWLDHGILLRWKYEALRLTLAPRTTLTVDFYLIMDPEVTHDPRPQLHEVKGFLREDAWVKLKTAATLYPEYRFFLVKRHLHHDTRQWHWEEMPSG